MRIAFDGLHVQYLCLFEERKIIWPEMNELDFFLLLSHRIVVETFLLYHSGNRFIK